MYIIKKDIPLPQIECKRGGSPKYPLHSLQVGECFIVPIGRDTVQLVKNRLQTAASQYRTRHRSNKRFIAAEYNEGFQSSVGMWRIE